MPDELQGIDREAVFELVRVIQETIDDRLAEILTKKYADKIQSEAECQLSDLFYDYLEDRRRRAARQRP